MTIDESLILGTPVFATKVGGIPEQVCSERNGMLVENDEQAILIGLRSLLHKPELLDKWRSVLCHEQFDEESIKAQLIQLFTKVG